LQLQAASHDNNSPQFAILLDSLDVLAAGDMKALKKKCGVSSDQLRDMINLLRSFNPKPGTLFETGVDPIRAPDLIVTKNSDGWRIDLNRSTLPSVQIDRDYAQAALKSAASDEDKGFLKERVAGARWLKSAVEQRNATTMRTGTRSRRNASIQSTRKEVIKENYLVSVWKPPNIDGVIVLHLESYFVVLINEVGCTVCVLS
jgi:RNA polymerase sigma-54 factor